MVGSRGENQEEMRKKKEMKARMPSRFGSSEDELDIDLRFLMRGGEIEKETLHDSATNKTLPDDLERFSFLGFFSPFESDIPVSFQRFRGV